MRGNNGRLFFSGERPLNELTDPTRKKKKSKPQHNNNKTGGEE